VVGFNIYASAYVGGGLTGYTRLNPSLITDYKLIEEQLTETLSDTDRTVSGNTISETVSTQNTYKKVYRYSYHHDRNASDTDTYPQTDEANTAFSGINSNQDLYYVATAVAYDTSLSLEYESNYTQELTSKPLALSTRVKDLTPRSLRNSQLDLIRTIQRTDSSVDLRPGEVSRDIHIDPPSWLANRLWVLVDFVNRAQSFLTLLQIDDPDSTGTSVPVSSSSYKMMLRSALNLTDVQTQTLIDESFTKLASNMNTSRQGQRKATGYVVVGRTKAPTKDLPIQKGATFYSTTGVAFQSTISKTMYASQASSYFNPWTGYYELTIPVEAVSAGLSGNVGVNQIRSSNVSGFSYTTNRVSTAYGLDTESNFSLAERARLSFAAMDRGTASGYLRSALDTGGVLRARVVSAGSSLMMRDWDEVREKHVGGKVDVWVQGSSYAEVQETFAYQYETLLNTRFVPVGEASNLRFKVASSDVTETTPLFAVLDDADLGYGLRNVSTGEDFDLTNVSIVDYQTIQLDTDRTQPSVEETDLLSGDIKYRSSNAFTPSQQPVVSVSSIISPTSTLTTDNYSLVQTEDPLLLGRSTGASDYLNVYSAGGLPTGDPISVERETVVLVGTEAVPLASVGVDITTLVVTNASGSITYESDSDSATPDYYVVEGTLTTPPTIARSTSGDIADGQTLYVSYTAEENFTVTYTVNRVLSDVNTNLQAMRHVTADVVVKQAVSNSVDIAFTAILTDGAIQADVDIQIRTELSKVFSRLMIGEDIHQSDIIRAIENVPGVRYVVVPLTRLHKSNGSLILRDAVDETSYTQLVEGVSADVFVLSQALTFSTSTGGGSTTLHRGIFANDQPLRLFDTTEDFCSLEQYPLSGLIVGSDGVEVCDCALGGVVLESGVDTANRILVSLPKGSTPDDYLWTVSYHVSGEERSADVEASITEYLTLGAVTSTYTYSTDTYGNAVG
tara:strand:- start:2908 stop:5784 length:2877 start_codon:yes stop_codon:yes gene_type:complete